MRVYALGEGPVRVDMSTVSVHAAAEGLVQFGFSKERRPDLPQVKVGMASLDPLDMPLATLVVAGNRADDPLYVPLIKQARQVVGLGKIYVGDSKMAATRAFLHQQGDICLWLAPRTVVSAETLACDVAAAYEEGRVTTWTWAREDGETGSGEACVVTVPMRVEVGKEVVTWEEERWVIRSEAVYRREVSQLEEQLQQAEAALEALNAHGRGKRRYRTQEALAARVERREDWRIGAVKRREKAVAKRQRLLGWQVSLTNSRAQGHPLTAVDHGRGTPVSAHEGTAYWHGAPVRASG